jgi:hypothetical protein
MGIKLESRVCACGCKAGFRCLPGSKQEYASALCRQDATGELPSYTPARKRGRRKKTEENTEMHTQNFERDYSKKREPVVDDADETEELEAAEEIEDAGDPDAEEVTSGDESEESEADQEDADEAEVAKGKGRFTMTVAKACDEFSLPRHKVNYWIKRKYLETYKESARKLYLDPTDIGRLIEEGPKGMKAIEQDEAELEAAPAEKTVKAPKPAKVAKKQARRKVVAKRVAKVKRGRPGRKPKARPTLDPRIVWGAIAAAAACAAFGIYWHHLAG